MKKMPKKVMHRTIRYSTYRGGHYDKWPTACGVVVNTNNYRRSNDALFADAARTLEEHCNLYNTHRPCKRCMNTKLSGLLVLANTPLE